MNIPLGKCVDTGYPPILKKKKSKITTLVWEIGTVIFFLLFLSKGDSVNQGAVLESSYNTLFFVFFFFSFLLRGKYGKSRGG